MTVGELRSFLTGVPSNMQVEVLCDDDWVAADGLIRVMSELDFSSCNIAECETNRS